MRRYWKCCRRIPCLCVRQQFTLGQQWDEGVERATVVGPSMQAEHRAALLRTPHRASDLPPGHRYPQIWQHTNKQTNITTDATLSLATVSDAFGEEWRETITAKAWLCFLNSFTAHRFVSAKCKLRLRRTNQLNHQLPGTYCWNFFFLVLCSLPCLSIESCVPKYSWKSPNFRKKHGGRG